VRRLLAISTKEFRHIVRDWRSLALAVAMPLMMVFLYGHAINMEMKNLKVGILDLDHSHASRELVRRMTSSGFILDAGRLRSREEVETGFRRGTFRAALIIPDGYERSLADQKTTPVQILIDGADGTTAAAVNAYLIAVVGMLNQDLLSAAGVPVDPILELRPRVFYNPELVSAYFIVPGLVSVILIMICVLLTSIAITREKETGTMEQIMTTPVRAAEVIIGKVIPYVGIGAVDATLVLLLGRLVFGVPMAGSWLVLAAYGLVYVLIALALGLLISAFARTQQLAMTMALMGTVMPSIMLSGFIFPIRSMPVVLQAISCLIPARYFLEILRGIMLRAARKFQSRLDLL
jgi:ABC-2 type transport system permease protein